ncbi:MAG: FecCD family ABC transporter permease [Anaerovoracaceae bacterium]
MKKRYIPLLVLLPVAAVVLSLFAGRYGTGAGDVFCALARLAGADTGISEEAYTVVVKLRLPRALAAVFVGASLAVSGSAYQGIFHNPLVSPGLLGVSAGAGFGAALSILLFGSGSPACYVMAFVFGVVAVLSSYWVAGIYRSVPAVMLVLGGTVVSAVFNALISAMKYIADTSSELPAIVYWLMGSLASVGWSDMWALIPMTAGILIIFANRWRINVLSMGDREAQALGVDTVRSKMLIVAGATLATAGAVCMSGVVGWVGLVVPHIGRIIAGNDNRALIPVSLCTGACFMVVVDVVSRTVTASELPLGILTSLIGAPFFIFLLKKTKGGGWQR